MDSTANIIRLTVIFAVSMLLQIVVLDGLDLVSLCNPMLYIVFLLSVPFGCSTAALMLLAAPTGLLMDIASNTPGMHMAACVLIAYLRQLFLRLLAFRSAYKESDMPSISACGIVWFVKYALLMTATHHVALFLIEQLDGFFFWPTLLRTLLSILATFFCLMLFEMAMPALGRNPED